MRAAALGILIQCCLPCWAEAETPETPETPRKQREQIEAWIKDLASDTYHTREEAEKSLHSAGLATLPALQETLKKSIEPEVRLRAARLMTDLSLAPEIAKAFKDLEAAEWDTTEKAIEILLKAHETSSGVGKRLRKFADSRSLRGRLATLMCNFLRTAAGNDFEEEEALDPAELKLAELKLRLHLKRARILLFKRCEHAHKNQKSLIQNLETRRMLLEEVLRAKELAQKQAAKAAEEALKAKAKEDPLKK